MQELRIAAWKLLLPFTDRVEGLPDPDTWTPVRSVFPTPSDRTIGIRPLSLKIDFIEGERGAEASTRPPFPVRYEATFFNTVAREYVVHNKLNVASTTGVLQQALDREIAFPRGSMTLKTFWYPVRDSEPIYPRLWDWRKLETLKPDTTNLPSDLLTPQCVMNPPVRDGCLPAKPSFYTVTLTKSMIDAKLFDCGNGCQGHTLKEDDLMVLAAIHVVSKQTPEWLWATFWWRGPDDKDRLGEFWTCQNAQRPEAVEKAGPWKNYSMDTTASFKYRKPIAADGEPCGRPASIGVNEGYAATYNPFVEASMANGLKSSCVHCHAKASTTASGDPPTPGPSFLNAASLDHFEGHIRLDYLWSLQRGLGPTSWP
jgi:hypothetical protein